MKRIRTKFIIPPAFILLVLFFGSCEISNSPGAYKLTTSATPTLGGTVSPSTGMFGADSKVTIEATPSNGYTFVEWTGDASGTENPISITMNKEKEVNAVFTTRQYPLTVNIQGQGQVTEEVMSQKDDYEYGTTVQLTAQADPGWEFVQWQGDLEGSENPAVITIDSEKTVTAVFEQTTFILTTNTIGGGSISETLEEEPAFAAKKSSIQASNTDFTSGKDFKDKPLKSYAGDNQVETSVRQSKALKSGEYESGSVVLLTAMPDEGWNFIRWEGDLDGIQNPVTIEMIENKEVTAVFEEESNEPQINISTTIISNITTTSATTGGNISADEGISVVARGVCYSLTATPDMNDNCTLNGSGSGNFNSTLDGLEPGTTYYVRAYALTDESAYYGNERSFTTVQLPDRYVITLNMTGQGTIDVSPDQPDYEEGSSLTLTAVAAAGWEFSHWEGDLQGVENPATIVMDSDKQITAVFESINYTVDIDITGEGTVSLDPNQASYEAGTVVELTAVAAEGWVFAGWQGDLVGEENPATITVNGNMEITALFEAIDYTIDMTIQGEGSVTLEPNQTTYVSGTQVTLTAVPAEGWVFVEWQGDLTGTDNPATITMDSDKAVTAVFGAIDYTLDVTIQGEGSVTLDPNQATYAAGTNVSLTAVPAEGWIFAGWQGDLTGTDNPATITMDSDKAVTAVFEAESFNIETSTMGSGAINLDPDQQSYTSGSEVTVTAVPAENWQFVEWQGDLTGTENPAVVIVNSDLSITALFEALEDTSSPPSSTVSHGYVQGVTPSNDPQFAQRTYPVILANWDGPGGNKRWLARNLGAPADPVSYDDDDPASNGWYFQFDLPQGYYFNGVPIFEGGNITPSGSFIISQDQSQSHWELENDPCRILFGGTWRVPTIEEWENFRIASVDEGGMDNGNAQTAFNSDLNLHISGSLDFHNGGSHRPGAGVYWSSISATLSQGGNSGARLLSFSENSSDTEIVVGKNQALSVRCMEA